MSMLQSEDLMKAAVAMISKDEEPPQFSKLWACRETKMPTQQDIIKNDTFGETFFQNFYPEFQTIKLKLCKHFLGNFAATTAFITLDFRTKFAAFAQE